MAKSILHLQEILVVAKDSGAGNLLRSSVGSQQIEAVADLLGLDHLGPAAPLQLTVWVHNIVKVFMGFEPLKRASHLASQFLRVHLFALDRRQPLEFVLCFAQSRLTPLLISLLTPGTAGNHVALALAHDFHHLRAIPQLGRLFGGQARVQTATRLGELLAGLTAGETPPLW